MAQGKVKMAGINVKPDESREAVNSLEDGDVHVPDIGGVVGEQAGTGETTVSIDGGGGGADGGTLVDVERVIEKYRANTGKRHNQDTQNQYASKFRAFLATVPGITREQLVGTKGKRALIDFLCDKRVAYRTAIRRVWKKGLNLPWPVDNDDLARPPRTRPSVAPETKKVLAFHEAMMKELRAERRLSWLMCINLGWSPADVVTTSIDEVQERSGIHYIMRERQKTGTWMVAVIPEETLITLKKVGKMHYKRGTVWRWWHKVAQKHGIPPVTPRQARKWFKVHARESGLSKPATASMMGHDLAGKDVQDWYDQPPIADILVEQSEKLPRGTLATVLIPKVELIGPDNEAMALWQDYKANKLTTTELMTKLEKLKTRELSVDEIGGR